VAEVSSMRAAHGTSGTAGLDLNRASSSGTATPQAPEAEEEPQCDDGRHGGKKHLAKSKGQRSC
jgi:hypothetical protein